MLLNGDCADPAVFREGDTYYLTYSSGPYYPGLPIFRSRDLVHWTRVGYAVREFGNREIWAPDFFQISGNLLHVLFRSRDKLGYLGAAG